MQTLINGLMRQLEGKDHMIEHLLEKIDSLESTIKEQGQSIEKMAGIISTYERRLFGVSSEKTHRDAPATPPEEIDDNDEGVDKDDQEEDEADEDGESPAGQSETDCSASPTRKKPYKHPKKRDYSDIECDDIVEIRPDAEEIKDARLVRITSSYRFYFVPGKLCKVKIDRYIYSKNGHLITPKLPYVPEPLEKRHASPNLIATLLVNKYLYHIPVERQLAMLNNGNIQIPKTTYHDWIKAGIDSLDGVYETIREKVLSDTRMHIDETTMPTMDPANHRTKKGYDWGFISPTHKVMFFARDNGARTNSVLDSQMKDFCGKYIQTDGYGSYVKVGERLDKDIIQIPCLAHVKRKFHDAEPRSRKKAGEALEMINQMFANERRYRERNLRTDQIEAHREIELRPLLDKFKAWLEKEINSDRFIADTNIGKAIHYARERIDKFYEVIKNGLLELSNNLAERTMRSHAMGRRNYGYCYNEESATRTCKIYSIIESCKMCGIDPYKYLCAVLSLNPNGNETWENYIPGTIAL